MHILLDFRLHGNDTKLAFRLLCHPRGCGDPVITNSIACHPQLAWASSNKQIHAFTAIRHQQPQLESRAGSALGSQAL